MIKTEYIHNYPVISLAGALTVDIQEKLKVLLKRILEENHTRIILDFAEVELITSSGLGLLFTVQKELEQRGGFLALAAAQPTVLSSIYDWRLDRFLLLFSSVDDAFDHLVKIEKPSTNV